MTALGLPSITSGAGTAKLSDVPAQVFLFTENLGIDSSAVGANDVGFVAQLLDTLSSQLCLDANRIYVTGMSNGAGMATTLGCNLAGRLADFLHGLDGIANDDLAAFGGFPAAGGKLIVRESEFDHNKDGFDTNSQNNDDAPSPQDGRCPGSATKSCTIIEDNLIQGNNNPNTPSTASSQDSGLRTGRCCIRTRRPLLRHKAKRRLSQAQAQRQDRGERAEFGDHCGPFHSPRRFSASATSRGM